jgi:hypothetical protein
LKSYYLFRTDNCYIFAFFSGCLISYSQASLNLLSCLDTLCQLPEVTLTSTDEDAAKTVSQKSHTKEDYSVVNR